MKRFYIMVSVLILISTICISGLVFINKVEAGDIELRPMPVDYFTVKVDEGDSLWYLGSLSNGWNHIDNTYVIKDIQTRSECTSLIYPGQTLYIPIYDFTK